MAAVEQLTFGPGPAWVPAAAVPVAPGYEIERDLDPVTASGTRRVAGVDHVGIGADLFDDGSLSMVQGLQDVTTYPVLFAELLRRGWSEADLMKLAGQNHLRAMREMERVASELQKTTSPSVTEGPRFSLRSWARVDSSA